MGSPKRIENFSQAGGVGTQNHTHKIKLNSKRIKVGHPRWDIPDGTKGSSVIIKAFASFFRAAPIMRGSGGGVGGEGVKPAH